VGATRGPDDEAIVDSLRDLARDLQITSSIEFMINKPRGEILDLFKKAKVAIHTMREEHFGISIVEMMSAGLIVIAHASAGPKMDIIGAASHPVGYLANDETTYTKFVTTAMT
jgi:alpha-1,2-mannosyltransferase